MKKDVFDRIMELPFLRIFNGFYRRYKSVLLYLFFGALTTFVSIFTFVLFYENLCWNELIANIISWIFAVLFAYFTNRAWVFGSEATGNGLLKEMLAFFVGRLTTLGIEEMILFVFTTALSFNGVVVKTVAQVVVLMLNYLVSKLFVFKKSCSHNKRHAEKNPPTM